MREVQSFEAKRDRRCSAISVGRRGATLKFLFDFLSLKTFYGICSLSKNECGFLGIPLGESASCEPLGAAPFSADSLLKTLQSRAFTASMMKRFERNHFTLFTRPK